MIRDRNVKLGRRWFSKSLPSSVRNLLEEVSHEYQIPVFEIRGRSHLWDIVDARTEAARRLRQRGWHPQAIGMFLQKHRTTVLAMLDMHGRRLRRIEEGMTVKPIVLAADKASEETVADDSGLWAI